jgi:hypothetical protein
MRKRFRIFIFNIKEGSKQSIQFGRRSFLQTNRWAFQLKLCRCIHIHIQCVHVFSPCVNLLGKVIAICKLLDWFAYAEQVYV